MTTDTLRYLLPEIVLIYSATAIVVVGAFVAARSLWPIVSLAGLGCAAYFLATQSSFENPRAILVADSLSTYVRWLALGVGALWVLNAAQSRSRGQIPEQMAALLFIVAGTMLVGSAQELTLMFVAVELVSIPTYVLLYLGRSSTLSQEATVKYFFLSVLSSAIMLYGFSFLYGVGGSTRLPEIAVTLASAEAGLATGPKTIAALAMVFVFAGLGFKIAAVPFHFYAPDVYQGTTNQNAGLLSVAPKLVGFIALIRILLVAMPAVASLGWRLALILALITMTVGNVVALWQTNIRRLLAYSSIAHGGYMLIGLAVAFAAQGNVASINALGGVTAVILYATVYALATIGTFAALTYLGTVDRDIRTLDELAGVGRAHPGVGVAIAVFMFSLAGIPPLAGFWGKLTLIAGALGVDGGQSGPLRSWFIALAIVAMLNAAIAAAYYLRVVAVVYFQPATKHAPAQGGTGALVSTAICAVLVTAAGVFPGWFYRRADVAAQSIGVATATRVETRTQVADLDDFLALTPRVTAKEGGVAQGDVAQ